MEDFYASLNIESVVISGGGVHGLSIYSILQILKKYNTFRQVRHWHGTSIGSICALCMILSVQNIRPFLHQIESKFSITPEAVLSIPDTLGMLEINSFRSLLEQILESAGILPKCTFDQLYRITQQTLSVYACSIDTNTLKIFNYKQTPNVCVIDAILASCTIPLVFQVYAIQNDRLIDGCFLSDWNMDTSISDPAKTLLIHSYFESNSEKNKIHTCMDYVQYLLYHGTQNMKRLSPAMMEIESKIAHTISIPLPFHSFHLPQLKEKQDSIQDKTIKILQSYSKQDNGL